MKKLVLLATAALVAMLILVPSALAQEMTIEQESTVVQPLTPTGGPLAPSVLLPAAALLLGSGVVAYALVRRR